ASASCSFHSSCTGFDEEVSLVVEEGTQPIHGSAFSSFLLNENGLKREKALDPRYCLVYIPTQSLQGEPSEKED
ncbi:hypothetical protein PMAYCL1PPCAC_02609, partial [Pristionchus mayeri]